VIFGSWYLFAVSINDVQCFYFLKNKFLSEIFNKHILLLAGLGSDDLWTANRPYSCFHRAWEEVPETAFYQTLKFGVVLSAFLHL
jgi:hypothetical protein